MPLADVFWRHVDRRISNNPKGRIELQKELKKLNRGRNKNTYSNWFREPSSEQKRPDIRLSVLEDVATALNVQPTALLTPIEPPASMLQMDLPFDPFSGRISLELEATQSALTVRIARSK
jgi:hypothetical protein